MFGISIAELTLTLRGKLLNGGGDACPSGASLDTRKLLPGHLFFALPGEKSDGHDYLEQAVAKGAAGAVVSRIPPGFQSAGFPLVVVEDVASALREAAVMQRRLFTGPVIAVTGSTGKTSTRDMIAAILREKGPVLSPPSNYNNELGLPLTILSLTQEHWAMVLEMGMRGLGEIDFLARIAEPRYGIITNVGHTHQELLGSRERIAQAKAELLSHIPGDGGVVLRKEDQDILKPWLSNIRSRVIWIGTARKADIWAENVQTNEAGVEFSLCTFSGEECRVRLPVPGKHNIANALSAAAVARFCGIPWETIGKGLGKTALTPMRLEIKRIEDKDITIIDDTYNANPASMLAALDVLTQVSAGKRKIAVLGDMYELGDYSAEGHKIVGARTKDLDIAYLITVGHLAREIAWAALEGGKMRERIRSCQDNQEALSYLKELIQPGDVILVKGSRGVKMEEIVAGILSFA